MLAIALLASGLAVAGVLWQTAQKREKERELLFIGKQFALAFRSYYDATPVGQQRFPARLEDLLADTRYPNTRRHLRRIYADPITGGSKWGLITYSGGIIGIHSLSEEAPIKTADFAADFAALAGKKKYSEWIFGIAAPGAGIAIASVPPTSAVSAPPTPGTRAGPR